MRLSLRHLLLVVDRKSTRLNSSHSQISYAVFCLKKKNVARHETTLVPCSDLERRRLKDRDKAWVVADRHLRECGVTPCLRRLWLCRCDIRRQVGHAATRRQHKGGPDQRDRFQIHFAQSARREQPTKKPHRYRTV